MVLRPSFSLREVVDKLHGTLGRASRSNRKAILAQVESQCRERRLDPKALDLSLFTIESTGTVRCGVPGPTKEREDSQLCVVCLDEPKEVVLQPCNHLAVCSKCSTQIGSECPLCRSAVHAKLKVYI